MSRATRADGIALKATAMIALMPLFLTLPDRQSASMTARAVVAIVLLTAAPGGCERTEAPPPADAARSAVGTRAESPWREIDGSPQIAVPADPQRADLSEAIEEARATMDDARVSWQHGREEDRPKWAVQWRAPTLDGGVEHLWVRPLSWSPFRIEGELANPPQRPLLTGADLGDVVSFAIEEAVDWVYFIEGDPEGPREGGFTIDVLEEYPG